MKRGIILVSMLICLFCSGEWAAGAGSHYPNSSHKWRKIEVWQKTQQERWKAIEREADRMLIDRNSNEGVSQTKPRGKRY